ncbi:MAG TPA: tRNA (adenosine(37)-N6)-dimethylallyltransferase MiaA [Thermomicrobiales bacterium]|nr:tRNA (adenosine(37)-N6)-dimethylallyltransferase MiaA [Thermomicrobiales bacterium]
MVQSARSLASASEGDNARQLTPGLRVVVILGATATGKTDLALRVAEAVGGEIVNADSRYFYRGMDIGTAKPSLAERARVPHHLVDILEPTEPFSLGAFLDLAYRAVEDVAARGKAPVVTGGTPQYLRAFLEGWRPPKAPPDEALRAQLDALPTDELYARLVAVDARSAKRTGAHNRRRMIRALEVYEKLGRPMSEVSASQPPPWRFLVIGLRHDREALYERIDRRVEAMHAAGWLDEVARLRERGVTEATPAMSAHGYREALAVLDETMTLDEAIRQTQTMVHAYVRHQTTWFRRFAAVRWLDSGTEGFADEALAMVQKFLAGDG